MALAALRVVLDVYEQAETQAMRAESRALKTENRALQVKLARLNELHPQHFLTNADIGKVYDVTFFNELHQRMEYEVMRFKGKQQIQQSERYIWGPAREDLPLVEILEFFASEH